MREWPKISLGNVLSEVNRFEAVSPHNTYPLLGVRLDGNGAFLRETVSGTQTSATRLNRVKQGDFIYSRLFAWRGAFGLIGAELDGSFVSNEFPIFTADVDRISTSFLHYWFRLPTVWRRVEEECTGSTPTTRNRYKEQFFLALQVPLPPLAVQHDIVERLNVLAEKTRQLEAHLEAVERDAEHLVRSYIFDPTCQRSTKRPMFELLSQRSPDVSVEGTATYRFAGVYSFGRGVFPSVVKMGSEFAYERLSTVRQGDFTYPKLMAWEGALGVVPAECDGMVVSPEFPVFTVDTMRILPEVLDIYFRTPEVWPTLAAISGGTNMRRRRLQPSEFLRYEMPVPAMETQIKLREIFHRVRALKVKHAAIRTANARLVPATLERIFAAAD
jgi:type I restriction enzyme S subunit